MKLYISIPVLLGLISLLGAYADTIITEDVAWGFPLGFAIGFSFVLGWFTEKP